MGILVANVESIKERLAALPAVEQKKREVSKQEAIAMLATEIASMQKRGYSLDEIASKLTSEGIEIKTTTLKNYLTRFRRAGKGKKRGDNQRRKEAATSDDPVSGHTKRKEGDRDTKQERSTEPPPSKGSFTAREDSDDI